MSIVNPLAKRDLYLPAINSFFKNPENKHYVCIFIRILTAKKIKAVGDKISINQVERYVLKYKKATSPVYVQYVLQLGKYTKQYFDPICRKNNDPLFSYEYATDKFIQTNIKQLNFFSWFFSSGNYDKFVKEYKEFKEDTTHKK